MLTDRAAEVPAHGTDNGVYTCKSRQLNLRMVTGLNNPGRPGDGDGLKKHRIAHKIPYRIAALIPHFYILSIKICWHITVGL